MPPDSSSVSNQKAILPPKPPRPVVEGVFAFPPNRDTLGGTAYLVCQEDGNILVDCPAWEPENQAFLQEYGVRWLFLTHRGGFARVKDLQATLNCQVVIQEQEAYLLPDVEVTPFHQEFVFTPLSHAFWTPGHSPGSACLYHQTAGGILFTGRHLLPDRQGNPAPLRLSKTFHWRRQLRSVELLLQKFSPETLALLCPGASTGFLRGERAIAQAYNRLAALDRVALQTAQAGL